MAYRFTKEQHERAKKSKSPLIGFTINMRYCDPPDLKINVSAVDQTKDQEEKIKEHFLEWLDYAYRGRKTDKKGTL